MKVCLYGGALKLVEKSGVGHAVLHQREMLESVGIETTGRDTPDSAVIHLNTVFPDSLLKAVAARLEGKKVIYYGHSTMEDFRHSFHGSDAFAPLFKKWIRLCYSRGDVIITPTEYSRRLLLSYGIQRPIVPLSNGIETDRFRFSERRRERFRRKYRLAEGEKAVLSVGHYIERKGILDFISMARANPARRFFWFGYTNLKLVPGVVRRAVEHAPENLTFPGYVESEELCDAYCGCDLFQFMSYEETEGIVVLEALSCEIPVVIRDIPVYDGWLTDRKNVYKARNGEEFQRAMDGILSGAWPDLRKAGRKVAEQRDVRRSGEKLLSLYAQLAVPCAAAGPAGMRETAPHD